MAAQLFRDGHYGQAILDTFIELIDQVRLKAGLDLDGSPLMQKAFSKNAPTLIVSSDPDEQLGYMWLFSGAVMGLRNPRAHRRTRNPTAQEALEWLAYASALFRILDRAKKAGP